MGEQSTQVVDAVARACAGEPQYRARLERAGDTSPLDRLIAAVRDGGEVAERVDELNDALQRGGDALGLFGPTRRGGNFRGVRPDGMGAPRPVEVAFLCPRGTCSRDWQPDPTAPPSAPPTCQVYREPLRWTRL